MTIDKRSEHAPFSSTSHTTPAVMPSQNTWIMDESTRNRLLKKYKTQVASGTSTICATLAVVSFPQLDVIVQPILSSRQSLIAGTDSSDRPLWRMSKPECKRELRF